MKNLFWGLAIGGIATVLYFNFGQKKPAPSPPPILEPTALDLFIRNYKTISDALQQPINAPTSTKKIATFDLSSLRQQRSNLQKMRASKASDTRIPPAIALCDTLVALGEKRNDCIARLNRSREQTEANRLVTANREGETISVVRVYDSDWRTREETRTPSTSRSRRADNAAQQADILRRIEHFDQATLKEWLQITSQYRPQIQALEEKFLHPIL